MAKKLPRGLRNNNPLNIRYVKSNNWLGKIDGEGKQDKAFEEFDTLEHGLRAGFVLLYNYMEKQNLCSVAQIIGRWAPMNENRTDVYINTVCEFMNLGANETFRFSEPLNMCVLVLAMACVECGVKLQLTDIFMAYYAVCLRKNVARDWDPYEWFQHFANIDWKLYFERVADGKQDYVDWLNEK